MSVLERFGLPNATWVETGTYFGETTAHLAVAARQVFSIEPDRDFAANAEEKFAKTHNVQILHGLSEELLPGILTAISGPICFWLDGHFSGPGTFQGPVDTPIELELQHIESLIASGREVVVFVDDVRLFGEINQYPSGEIYPHRSLLVNWADRNGMTWTIEHDIFIAWPR